MVLNKFSKGQFQLTKWSFLVHSTTRNAAYIHPSHDSILELWQTFLNAQSSTLVFGHFFLREKADVK